MSQTLAQINWSLLTPELIVIAGAVLILIVDLLLGKNIPRKWLGLMGVVSLIASFAYTLPQLTQAPAEILSGTYRLDPLSVIFKLIILVGSSFIVFLSMDREYDPIDRYISEEYVLLLTGTLGAMFMASSADLITLFIGLELLSLSSYILVGIRKHESRANESAWKYVIIGGFSSAFFLYGLSFLYGLTGTTNMFDINRSLSQLLQLQQFDLLIILSLLLMLVGLGFKVSSAPFHMWAPDVYQGASAPVASFLAVVSKTAGFVLILKAILIVYLPLLNAPEWTDSVVWVLVALASLSMIVGNTIALRQKNIKRLLAYSSIAQAGYIMIAIASLNPKYLFGSVVFYLVAYLLMTIGAFTVVHVVSKWEKSDEITAFDGLYHRSPVLAVAMTFFLLSLAGIPLTVGFMGKLYLAFNIISSQHIWVIAVLLLTTVISYYYYFQVIRRMFNGKTSSQQPVNVSWIAGLVILLTVIGTVGFGVAPDLLLKKTKDIKFEYGIIPMDAIQQMEEK